MSQTQAERRKHLANLKAFEASEAGMRLSAAEKQPVRPVERAVDRLNEAASNLAAAREKIRSASGTAKRQRAMDAHHKEAAKRFIDAPTANDAKRIKGEFEESMRGETRDRLNVIDETSSAGLRRALKRWTGQSFRTDASHRDLAADAQDVLNGKAASRAVIAPKAKATTAKPKARRTERQSTFRFEPREPRTAEQFKDLHSSQTVRERAAATAQQENKRVREAVARIQAGKKPPKKTSSFGAPSESLSALAERKAKDFRLNDWRTNQKSADALARWFSSPNGGNRTELARAILNTPTHLRMIEEQTRDMDPAMRDDLLAHYGLTKKPRRVRKDAAFMKHVARIDRAAAHITARDVVGQAWEYLLS